jgi:hypothetical protein
MGWLIALYIIVGLVTLYLFRNAKWRILYALTWPLSLVLVGIWAIILAITPSDSKFKLENM